ncbi:MAG: PQQ-binding-like beta-propeller repeat protein [Pseudomonadota bacterium]
MILIHKKDIKTSSKIASDGRFKALIKSLLILPLCTSSIVYAVTPGQLAWKSTNENFSLPVENGQVASAPAINSNGDVLAIAYDGSGNNQDQLALFNNSGDIKWQTSSISLITYTSPSEKFYSPVISRDGTSFIATDNNNLFIIAADGSYIGNSFWSNYRGIVMDDSSDRIITYVDDIFSKNGDVIYSHTFNSSKQYQLTENWKFALSSYSNGFSAFNKPQISTQNGITYALLAPLVQVSGEATGVFNTQACVIAIKADGEQDWSWCNDTYFPPNSKIVFDGSGNLYFSTTNRVISLTAQGVKRWGSDIGGGAVQPAVSSDGIVFINTNSSSVGGKKSLYSLDSDGSQRWLLELDSGLGIGNEQTIPLFAKDGTIYFTSTIKTYDSSVNNYILKASLIAISSNGQLQWTYDSGEQGNPSSPAFNNDQSLIYFTAQGHSLYAVNTGTIAELYEVTVSDTFLIDIPKLKYKDSYYSVKLDSNRSCWSARDLTLLTGLAATSNETTVTNELMVTLPRLKYQGKYYSAMLDYNGTCWTARDVIKID